MAKRTAALPAFAAGVRPAGAMSFSDLAPGNGSDYQQIFGLNGIVQSAKELFINARFNPRQALILSRSGLVLPRGTVASDPVNVAFQMIWPPYASLAA